jgi:uncharacterized protein YutE (UPF0331/DUF86 family)
MVDQDLIMAKAGAVKKHVDRVLKKSHVDAAVFSNDSDLQDIVLFNIQMGVQNCLDIAAHIISDEGFGVPGSNNEMFYLLEENGYIDAPLVEKMIAAVGFRNLVVHEYGKLDLPEVYNISRNDIRDLLVFVAAIFKKVGL